MSHFIGRYSQSFIDAKTSQVFETCEVELSMTRPSPRGGVTVFPAMCGARTMFTYKDIIQMEIDTCTRLVEKINASQSAFTLRMNHDEDALEFCVGDNVVERFRMKFTPWVEPGEDARSGQ